MADTQGGRARGRARGRSRGSQSEPPRRPGVQVEVPPQQMTQMAAAAPVPVTAPLVAGGRAMHRGGKKHETRHPGGGDQAAGAVGELATRMGKMAVGEEGKGDSRIAAGRGVSRGGRQDDRVTTRPAHIVDKRGEGGDPIKLYANYFKVNSTPDWVINQYHVTFDPDIESLGMRKAMMGDHKALFKSAYLFDGMALWSNNRLEHESTEVFSQRRSDGSNIRITIKFIRELDPNDPVVLQICNIQMRKNFSHMKFQLLGRNYFDMSAAAQIPKHKLEIWPGFVTSIRQHETSVLMCVDLSFKILRQESVLDMLYKIHSRDERNFKDNANKQLLGSIVMTRYNNKTYRIDDINWKLTPTAKFPMRDGSEISYIEYYEKHWQCKITDNNQPLLVSAPKKRDIKRGMTQPFLLIPEFCVMTGLDEETRSDFMVMKDIAVHTRVGPDARVENLLKFLNRIQSHKEIEREMQDWGLQYARNLVEIDSRILQSEGVFQSGARLPYDTKQADWSREMRGRQLQSCVPLKNWILVVTQRDAQKADDFLQNLRRVGPPMGINVANPQFVTIADDRTNTFIRGIRENLNASVQLVCVVVPNNRKDRYDAVKKLCCLDFPVASQVIVARTLSKRQMLMSVATKIAIQLNCKLGGEVWTLDIPLKNLMVVGYDSYHDSSKKGRSVGGIVCSTNSTLTKYHSRVTFQERHQEMLDGFCVNFIAMLRRYLEINGNLPQRIAIYRDGVGDGQLAQVKEWELPQIEQCFQNIGQDYKPKWTFIVVTKRINSRFFSKNSGIIGNPPPGTIIDTEVTRPERYDFFLISQSVRQGTVSPTQYNVLFDTSQLRPTFIQRLTYKLTHLYYNWPGTIRVPAPCQYAHKLAFLVGQSLHRDPHLNLCDTLYYL